MCDYWSILFFIKTIELIRIQKISFSKNVFLSEQIFNSKYDCLN